MKIETFAFWLIAAFSISLLIFVSGASHAEGAEYTTTEKPVRCSHPTTNVDGTALLEVTKATIYAGQTPGDTTNYDLKIDIPGGCQSGISMDISSLTPGVQYYTYGELHTVGGVADVSNAIPFLRALPRPNPLQMLE